MSRGHLPPRRGADQSSFGSGSTPTAPTQRSGWQGRLSPQIGRRTRPTTTRSAQAGPRHGSSSSLDKRRIRRMLKRLLSIGSRFCPGRQRRNPPNRTIVLIVAPRAMTNRLSARTGSRGIVRIVARLTRGLRLGLVAAVMAFVLGACHFDGGGVELSALNESDHAVVLNVVAEQTRTFVLPAHSYAGLYGTWTRLSPTWHVRVFDDSCHLIVDQQITVTSGVLHVAADGTIAWKRDTGGATGYETVPQPSPTDCPS